MFGFGTTKGGKCDSTKFKLQQIEPQNGRYKLNAVQCTSCGTPFGVVDYYDTHSVLQGHEKKMAQMQQQLGQIDHYLRQILQAMQR